MAVEMDKLALVEDHDVARGDGHFADGALGLGFIRFGVRETGTGHHDDAYGEASANPDEHAAKTCAVI